MLSKIRHEIYRKGLEDPQDEKNNQYRSMLVSDMTPVIRRDGAGNINEIR